MVAYQLFAAVLVATSLCAPTIALPTKDTCGLKVPVINDKDVRISGAQLGSGSGGSVSRTEKLDAVTFDTVVKKFGIANSFVKETLSTSVLCEASTCPRELPLVPLVAAVVDDSQSFNNKAVFGSAGSITLEALFQLGDRDHVVAAWRKIVDASTYISAAAGSTQAGRLTALRELDTGLVILQQLALAVQHMRERSFIHQDIKHQNAMCGEDGACRLIDMDLACHTAEVKMPDGRAKAWPAELRGFDPQCPAQLGGVVGDWTNGMACSFLSRSGNSVYQSPLAGLVKSIVTSPNSAWADPWDGSADAARNSAGRAMTPTMDMVGMLDVYSLGFLALELLTGTEQTFLTGVLAADELGVTGLREWKNTRLENDIYAESLKAPRDETYSQTLVMALQKFLNLGRWSPGPADEGERLTADHRMLAVLKSLAQHLPSNRPAGSSPIFHFRDTALDSSLAEAATSTAAAAAGSASSEAAAARRSLRKAATVAQQALQPAGAAVDEAAPAAAALLEVAADFEAAAADGAAEAAAGSAAAVHRRADTISYAGRSNNAGIVYQTCPLCELLRVTHRSKRDSETSIPLVFQAKGAKEPTFLSTRHGDPSTDAVGMTILKVVDGAAAANAIDPAAAHLAERIPPTQVATASLMRLLRRMLSLHAEEVPSPSDVVTALDVIRMQVYVQEGAAVPEADTHVLEDHLGCVKACVAVAEAMSTGPGETAPAKDAICSSLEAPLHAAAKFCAPAHDALSAYDLNGKKLSDVMANPNALSQAAASSICRRNVCKAGSPAITSAAGTGSRRQSNRLSLVSNADMEALQSRKPIDFTKAVKSPVTAKVFHGWKWSHMRSIRIEAGLKKGDPPTLAWWAPDAANDSPAKNRFPVAPAFGAGPCSVMATVPGFPDIRGGCGNDRGFCACTALLDTRSTATVKPLLVIRILFAKEAEGLRFINVLHQAITDASVKA